MTKYETIHKQLILLQKKYGLTHWDICLEIIDEDIYGKCCADYASCVATISIARTIPANQIVKTLHHELLHILLSSIMNRVDMILAENLQPQAYHIAMELLIENEEHIVRKLTDIVTKEGDK